MTAPVATATPQQPTQANAPEMPDIGARNISEKRASKSRFGVERRKTPKATTRPRIRDLARIAGFFEGEGNFAATTSESVTIYQVNREPLEKVQQFLGGTIRAHTPSLKKRNTSTCWRWAVSGKRARGVLFTLFPFLSSKRKQQAIACLKNTGMHNDYDHKRKKHV